ncbi:hypothetical protein NC652_018675 [Populus alba x Populus x berolinensis]|nr:hypothetical protein NC652_018675 [Populus alba x Populus x berolinensis]
MRFPTPSFTTPKISPKISSLRPVSFTSQLTTELSQPRITNTAATPLQNKNAESEVSSSLSSIFIFGFLDEKFHCCCIALNNSLNLFFFNLERQMTNLLNC